jgi:quercetin dioxygenase-like cupin family protein
LFHPVTEEKTMSIRLSTLAILLAAPLLAQSEGPAHEASVTHAVKESALQWGPCPAFIPKGCEIAVLHGDPGKGNADVFFKVPPGFEIPNHWHTSAERMTLSSGQLTIQYEGQAPVTLRPGMYAYGPAKVPHKATCAKGDACVLFIAFESPIDAFPVNAK